MQVKLTNKRTSHNCGPLTVGLPAHGFSVTEHAATEYATHFVLEYKAASCQERRRFVYSRGRQVPRMPAQGFQPGDTQEFNLHVVKNDD
jgi:hypothetical protein